MGHNSSRTPEGTPCCSTPPTSSSPENARTRSRYLTATYSQTVRQQLYNQTVSYTGSQMTSYTVRRPGSSYTVSQMVSYTVIRPGSSCIGRLWWTEQNTCCALPSEAILGMKCATAAASRKHWMSLRERGPSGAAALNQLLRRSRCESVSAFAIDLPRAERRRAKQAAI